MPEHKSGPDRLPIKVALLAKPMMPPRRPAGDRRVSSLYVRGDNAPTANPMMIRIGKIHSKDGTKACAAMPIATIIDATVIALRYPMRSLRDPHHGALIMVKMPTRLTAAPASVESRSEGAPNCSK